MRLQEISNKKIIIERYHNQQQQLLESVCHGMTGEQKFVVENIVKNFQPLVEYALTQDQINSVFGSVEKNVTATGSNRTALGKSKDVVAAANRMIDDAGRWLQDTKPVQGFDQRFEKIKRDLRNKLGTSTAGKKVLTLVDNLGDYAKENPGKTAFAIGVLTAVAAIATGPVGGAIAGQVLRGSMELVKGEKLSTAVGKGAKTAAIGALAGMTLDNLGDMVLDNLKAANESEIDAMIIDILDANMEERMNDIDPELRKLLPELEGASSISMQGYINNWYYDYDVILVGDDIETYNELKNSVENAKRFSDEYYQQAAKFHNWISGLQKDPMQQQYRAAIEAVTVASQDQGLSDLQWERVWDAEATLDDKIDALSRLDKGVAAAAQAGAQLAVDNKKKAIKVSEPKQSDNTNESLNIEKSININRLFTQIAYLSEKQQLDEISLASIKQQAAKIAQRGIQKAQDVGKNMTTRVTVSKLQKAWEKAGSPTDSAAIAQLLTQQGIKSDIISQSFKDHNLEVPDAQTQDGEQQPADDQTPTDGEQQPVPNEPVDTPNNKFDGAIQKYLADKKLARGGLTYKLLPDILKTNNYAKPEQWLKNAGIQAKNPGQVVSNKDLQKLADYLADHSGKMGKGATTKPKSPNQMDMNKLAADIKKSPQLAQQIIQYLQQNTQSAG